MALEDEFSNRNLLSHGKLRNPSENAMSSAQFAQKLSHMESGPRRVPRSEIVKEKPTWDDPVSLCLELWKEWMNGDPDRDLGMRRMPGLIAEGDGHGVDENDARELRDKKIAAATDAMIDSLSRIHVWAINRSCSITSSWNFPNCNFEEVAIDARIELEKKLRKNICTSTLF